MGFSKNELLKQQQHEHEAAERAASKQSAIAADLDALLKAGGADADDIRRLQQGQAELAEDIEILRRREREGF